MGDDLAAKQLTFSARAELQGGIESTLLGFSASMGPILLFVGILGSQSLAAALWATLVTATVVPAAGLLFKGQPAILPSARSASLTAYLALVLLLGNTAGPSTAGLPLSAQQLLLGLAAASLLFAAASALILLIGVLRLGGVFKMIPNTVTSGVMNGTAAMLVWLAAKQLLHSAGTHTLAVGAMLLSFILLPMVQRRVRALRLVPAVIVALLVGWAAEWAFSGSMPAGATVAYDLSWVAIRFWPALLQQPLGHLLAVGLPGAVTLALVMILESITAYNTMETRFGVRSNINRELVVLGGANLVSAALGGVPSTASSIRSVANWRAGGRGRIAGLASLALTGVLLLLSDSWLLALPVGVVAGMLLLQASLMVDMSNAKRVLTVVKTRRLTQDGSADQGFWLSAVISVVGFFGGLIWACFTGVGLSALVVLRRLSLNLTAQWAYLDQYRSHRIRPAHENAGLAQLSRRVGVLRLTGHLFFGNSARLSQLVDELHEESVAAVIDVSRVRDVDSSGVAALVWVVRTLAERGLTVVLTGLKSTPATQLQGALRVLPGLNFCIDLDHGLERCEEQLLGSQQAATSAAVPLEHNQLLQDLSVEDITAVIGLGTWREVAPGAALFYRNDEADGVWLLVEGRVSILAGGQDLATASRLATFGPGQFVGEMSYVDGGQRSATARADGTVRALLLNREALASLFDIQPAAALSLTRNIARELSHRLRNSSALLAAADRDESVISPNGPRSAPQPT